MRRLVGTLAAVLLVTTGGLGLAAMTPASAGFEGDVASAQLMKGDGTAIGVVSFHQLPDEVNVRVEIGNNSGLAPGFHGFHVHDVNLCEGPGFTSAQGHWNPDGELHGQHAGDNPVLLVRDDGSVQESFTTDNYTVDGLLAAEVAVIVHAGPDNYANIPATKYFYDGPDGDSTPETGGADPATTGATGDAGARAACGVVTGNAPDLTAGYWMVASDGGVFNHGTAAFLGSRGGEALNSPILGLESTPSGGGYYLAAGDGGIFSYGDAEFQGSTGAMKLNQPVVDMAVPSAHARALLIDATGVSVGHVTFTEDADGLVHVRATAKDLPAGFHGFHVHDVDKCEGPGFTSAGGHWNPGGALHGSHAGDQPVLFSAADNTAEASFTTDDYKLADLLAAQVAVIVHASPDNYANIPASKYFYDSDGNGSYDKGGADPATTGLTGDAGARTFCGVVQPVGGTTEAGYWLAARDGGIFAFGDAPAFGANPLPAMTLKAPIVAAASTPTGDGLWLVASDGGVFAFGDATFFGSTGAMTLNKPIVGVSATPTGRGYYLVGSDGGIFNYGDATYEGGTGAIALNQPIVGLATTTSGHGYWLFAADGGVFNYGDAAYRGSQGATKLNRPVVGGAAHFG